MTDIFETLESEVRGYCRSWPTVFERSQGSTMYAEDGKEYLDFFSGAGALNYGHNNPLLLEPLLDYLRSGAVVHSLDMKTPAKRRFLETFQEVILKPRGMDHKVMFPGPTGTNSVEAALKLARKVTGRQHILSFTNAFHGMTLGSLSVTGNSMKRKGAGIPLTNSSKIPYDDYFDGETADFLWLERVLEDSGSGVDKPAAVIVETVQGEGGLNAARLSWLKGLSELCKKHDILLIADEGDLSRVAKGLELGANDYLLKPIDRNELLARVRTQVRRKRYHEKLRHNYEQSLSMALTDSLTGVFNRRYVSAHLPRLLERSWESQKPVAILMFDIATDHPALHHRDPQPRHHHRDRSPRRI